MFFHYIILLSICLILKSESTETSIPATFSCARHKIATTPNSTLKQTVRKNQTTFWNATTETNK